MLPNGWRRSTVGASCAIKNYLRLPISTDQRSTMPGEYPYFGPTGVLDYIDHYRINEEFALIGEDGDHFLKFREKPMTLLFNGKANVNNHAHVIGNSQECLASWFHYWFMHRDLAPALSRQGVGRYKLTKSGLEKLEIILPPLREQKAICDLLAIWDLAISNASRLLANSRQQKEAILGKFLRGSNNWKTKRLDQIAARIKRESGSGEPPVLMISASNGFVRQSEMYSRFMAGKSVENYILLERGEFAYNKGNSKSYEFGCIYPLEDFDQGLVPHVYVCFSLDESVCHRPFYKYLFEADYLHDQLGTLVNTGVRNNGLLNIRPADFMSTTVPVPPISEQIELSKILAVASANIQNLELRIAALKEEKTGLMQQLLTGKRRVAVSPPVEAQPA